MRFSVVLLYVLCVVTEVLTESFKPRRSISFKDVKLRQFKESESVSFSSLAVRDDLGRLVLGAGGKILALKLEDISRKTSEEHWSVSSADRALCQMKGKSSEECENFIRVLHTMGDGNMLVCGTNAFNPACDVLNFTAGNMSLERKPQDGRGKVPFDPNQHFASFMDGSTLYSATSSNFLGTEMVFQRHGPIPLRTEVTRSWLHEPTMVSINMAGTSRVGEDDLVFLFFSEIAVEERRGNIRVSRIARVCKSDLGGKMTLQKRWTSFLKARLDCPFGDAGSSPLVQDVFLLQDQNNIEDSIFYAVFTSNPEPSSLCSQSAVCAYKLSDIRQVFRGKFLTESATGSWDTYTGEEPFPYPGSCIDDSMRALGVLTSLNLSDSTLLFVKKHPLLEGVVAPIGGRPLLVQAKTRFSKIIVDQVTSLDGKQHQIFLIGTDSGWLQKAVKFDGEDAHIIEELQIFQDPLPVNFLRLSAKTVRLSVVLSPQRSPYLVLALGGRGLTLSLQGQLYSCAGNTAVEVDIRDCSSYRSCGHCLLARDPNCGWDQTRQECASVSRNPANSTIQSLSDGDIRLCSTFQSEERIITLDLTVDTAQFLPCSSGTNLPISWRRFDRALHPGPRLMVLPQGLVLWPRPPDAGLYSCVTVETVRGRELRTTAIRYLVRVEDPHRALMDLRILLITLSVFTGFLAYFVRKQIRRMFQYFSFSCCKNSDNNVRPSQRDGAIGMFE